MTFDDFLFLRQWLTFLFSYVVFLFLLLCYLFLRDMFNKIFEVGVAMFDQFVWNIDEHEIRRRLLHSRILQLKTSKFLSDNDT
ncbi:hypothetical protein Zmor_013278 [Zophobas morio]|uniref:Uncharacterized protein n=1 Tax=Zophobas morio TaxID=2755281 RepID=A0AA38IFC6_9CUCU|nr:hypothetical protein Zmor_013278 [Zophobas morio]